jgi:hypothetical protein
MIGARFRLRGWLARGRTRGVVSVFVVVAMVCWLASAVGVAPARRIVSGAGRASEPCVSQPFYASSQLVGVAATSPTNAWAVGYNFSGVVGSLQTVIERWNGSAWTVQPSPKRSHSQLSGVAATSSTNAWAVGGHAVNLYLVKNLIEHWNGKAWKVQTSPTVRSTAIRSKLSGVVATSSTNAWAVGGYTEHRVGKTLIEHWNGKAWKVQKSPNPRGEFNGLVGVTATSATNAWAVGYDRNGTLIEHWNGKAWKVETSPTVRTGQLAGVAATSSRNAWAVGTHFNYFNYSCYQKTLIEHWNGNAWKIQKSPSPTPFHDSPGLLTLELPGVSATSPRNAWAVGYNYDIGTPGSGSASQALIEHWNGKAWTVQKGSNGVNTLLGVAATSSTNAWAVGTPNNGSMIEHWNGKTWKIQ